MYVFIVPMLAGLVGLAMMALPGLSRHGGGHAHTGHVGHAGHAGHAAQLGHAGHGAHLGKGTAHATSGQVGPLKVGPQAHLPAHAGPTAVQHGAASASHSILEILDPRLLFSLMALFGASGQIALSLGLGAGWSAVLAVPAAAGMEWAIVGRLWRLAMRFEGQPSSPMESLLYEEVEAVTAFHNGKGMVRAVKDGRSVQLMARLEEAQTGDDVRTGDRLRILEVDPENERVIVTRT